MDVRRRHPVRWIAFSLCLTLLLLSTGWGGYRFGSTGIFPWATQGILADQEFLPEETRQMLAQMRQRIADLELSGDTEVIARMRQRILDLEMGGDIEYQVTEQLRATIGEFQDQVAALEEEIQVYKSIMSPDLDGSGLRVGRFLLSPGQDQQHVRYSLLLIQVAERHGRISGHVSLTLNGIRSGRAAALPVEGVTQEDQPFDFRYFQELEGEIRVPGDFGPTGVLVSARRNKGGVELNREFNWELQDG